VNEWDEKTYGGEFIQLVFTGMDAYDGLLLQGLFGTGPAPAAHNEFHILGFNDQAFRNGDEPPMFDRWRLGGELVLPFVRGWLYPNQGQLADLMIGLTTLDLARDDGQDEPRDDLEAEVEEAAASEQDALHDG
jgi:hypothetical protein